MTAHTPEQCAQIVFPWARAGVNRPCHRRGTIFEQDKWWCFQHAPSAVKKHKDERAAKWAAERKDDRKKHAKRQKEILAYEHTYAKGINPEAVQDMLDALDLIVQWAADGYPPTDASKQAPRSSPFGKARAARDKAREPQE